MGLRAAKRDSDLERETQRGPDGRKEQLCSAQGTRQRKQDGEKVRGGRCICERRACVKEH